MRLLLPALCLAFPFFCNAQNEKGADSLSNKNNRQHRPFSASISFFNQSVSVPFHKVVNSPLHPGMQAGIEGRYFENAESKLFQTLNLGMFYNKYNGTGIYLNSEVAYRYTSKFRVYAEALVGIGYLRTYHPSDIYELTNSGTYEKASDHGFSSAMFSAAFGLGYAIKSYSAFSFAPFIRYEGYIQTPYSGDFSVFPQTMLHIGLRITKKRPK